MKNLLLGQRKAGKNKEGGLNEKDASLMKERTQVLI